MKKCVKKLFVMILETKNDISGLIFRETSRLFHKLAVVPSKTDLKMHLIHSVQGNIYFQNGFFAFLKPKPSKKVERGGLENIGK